jgi:hypothetical protein
MYLISRGFLSGVDRWNVFSNAFSTVVAWQDDAKDLDEEGERLQSSDDPQLMFRSPMMPCSLLRFCLIPF